MFRFKASRDALIRTRSLLTTYIFRIAAASVLTPMLLEGDVHHEHEVIRSPYLF
jgi:hypothetical protein